MSDTPAVDPAQNSVQSSAFPRWMTLGFAVCLLILLSLGTWQLSRLVWKQQLIARQAASEAAPPVPLALALARSAKGEDVRMQRVILDGCTLPSKPGYLLLYGVVDGQAGWRPLTACQFKAADGQRAAILVELGIVSGLEAPDDLLPPIDPAGPVQGRLMPLDMGGWGQAANQPKVNRWYRRDAAAMAQALGVPSMVAYSVVLDTPQALSADARISPVPVSAPLNNRHLEYALTWYGLALSLAGVYGAVLWQRRQKPRAEAA